MVRRCEYHLEDDSCQLLSPQKFHCQGEDRCTHYQLEAKKLCPDCNKMGASWSGYGKPGGLKYTCWSCGHTWTEPLTWPKTPGVCLRCGREFENPVPEVIDPEGGKEIATSEWCSDCNKLVMSIVFREVSAYRTKGFLYDPLRIKEVGR